MSQRTHMKVYRGFDMSGPQAECGQSNPRFAPDGVRATCKRCWARHERIMKIIRAERAAKLTEAAP